MQHGGHNNPKQLWSSIITFYQACGLFMAPLVETMDLSLNFLFSFNLNIGINISLLIT